MGTGSDTEQDWAPFSSTDLAITPAPYGDLHTVSPFVATPQAAIDLILKGLKLTAEDFLVDLGCGRGTINICAASQFKCRGLGVDIDGSLVEEARKEAEEKGVGERVEFREEDVATTDLTSATAITSFLVPRQLRILQPTLLKFLARGGKLACYHYRSAWLILFFQKYCRNICSIVTFQAHWYPATADSGSWWTGEADLPLLKKTVVTFLSPLSFVSVIFQWRTTSLFKFAFLRKFPKFKFWWFRLFPLAFLSSVLSLNSSLSLEELFPSCDHSSFNTRNPNNHSNPL